LPIYFSLKTYSAAQGTHLPDEPLLLSPGKAGGVPKGNYFRQVSRFSGLTIYHGCPLLFVFVVAIPAVVEEGADNIPRS